MLSLQELRLRAALFRSVRSFFDRQGFVEVDTPILQPVIIPESTILPLRTDRAFLQTSPELYMKRLLAAGCGRIYQICRCFRREERGRRHLEEFVMLEWYRRDADYSALMEDCEALICAVTAGLEALGVTNSTFAGFGSRPWPRITVAEAFARFSPAGIDEAIAQGIFDEILVEYIEPRLGSSFGDGSPVFLYEYPSSMASLARKSPANQAVAERFELYINGVEVANAFSELTDADEQRLRFEQELAEIERSRGERHRMPEKFLTELGNIDEAAGIALGLDRLFMLLLGKMDINDAVTFSPDDD